MIREALERMLERIAERTGRTPVWEKVRRDDLLGESPGAGRPRPSFAEESFAAAWGRAALRDEDLDEHAEYPGFGGAA